MNKIPTQNDYYNSTRTRSKYAEPGFRFKSFQSEYQRKKNAMEHVADLDIVPNPDKKIEYRQRVPDNDINPVIRFQPRNDSERVIDYIRNGGFFPLQGVNTSNELKFYLHLP